MQSQCKLRSEKKRSLSQREQSDVTREEINKIDPILHVKTWKEFVYFSEEMDTTTASATADEEAAYLLETLTCTNKTLPNTGDGQNHSNLR